MAKVICTLPNASENISGVNFEQTEHGMLSETISDEQAASFTAIKGYELADEDGHPAGGGDGQDDLEALRKRAVELGIEVKSTWKAARLTAEVKRAEEAAANKGA